MSLDRQPVSGAAFILDAPDDVPAVWGSGSDVVWSSGEPFMLCGPQGVGKTTLAQQLVLARAGIREPTLLGMPVAVDGRPVLCIAADRPAQAARSFRRMVSAREREALAAGLLVWRGPLPFTVTDNPLRLAEWIADAGAGTVVIDSLKDIAVGLSDDAVGAAVNQSLQAVVASGVEVMTLHHQRKGQDGRAPRKLEDVYGSTWLTAGYGSVALVWGEPGDPYVELRHLKQPAAEVGPLDVYHDHDHGRSSLPGAVDLMDLAAASAGITPAAAAGAIYGKTSPTRSEVEKVRRRLEKLARADQLARQEPTEPGGPVIYRVTPRDPLREGGHGDVTEGHDLALQLVTQPSRTLTDPPSRPPTPFRGARGGERDPLSNGHDAERMEFAERVLARNHDLAEGGG